MSCDIRDVHEAVLISDGDFSTARLQVPRCRDGFFSVFWFAHIRDSDGISDREIQCEILHVTGIVLELQLVRVLVPQEYVASNGKLYIPIPDTDPRQGHVHR